MRLEVHGRPTIGLEVKPSHKPVRTRDLDRSAHSCYTARRIKRGRSAPPTSRTGNGGEDDVACNRQQ
jgi:hypothetical protein